MTPNILSLALLAGLSLALGACATGDLAANDRPDMPPVSHPPVFLHDMAIANEPYPHILYVDYMDEPTRFEFHPRNIVILDDTDNGMGDQPVDNGDAGGDAGGGE